LAWLRQRLDNNRFKGNSVKALAKKGANMGKVYFLDKLKELKAYSLQQTACDGEKSQFLNVLATQSCMQCAVSLQLITYSSTTFSKENACAWMTNKGFTFPHTSLKSSEFR
jgi:hypothetical protein